MDCAKVIDEIIRNKNKDLLNGEEDPEVPVSEVVNDSQAATIKGMQQQMDLFRRFMYLMAVVLLVVFLITVASLIKAVATMTGIRKTLSSNQAISSQGKVDSLTRNLTFSMNDHYKTVLSVKVLDKIQNSTFTLK